MAKADVGKAMGMVKGQVAGDPYALRDPYEQASRAATPRAKGAPGCNAGGGRAKGEPGSSSASGDGSGSGKFYEEPRAFGNEQLAVALCVALALLVAAGVYAWNVVRTPDISAYAGEEITISGLADEDFTVTVEELSQLKCSQLTVDGKGKGQGQDGESKAGTVMAYGPTLVRFLAEYGYEPTDFSRVVATCYDDYKVTLVGSSLEQTILLSIAQGKEALDERHQPLRLIAPSEESGKWCYGVVSLQFERASDDGGNSDDQGVITVEESQLAEGALASAGAAAETGGASDAASGNDPESAASSGSGISFGQL